MTCPLTTCNFWYSADQDCARITQPHEAFCAHHLDRDLVTWAAFHHINDCCVEHCADADHEEDDMETAAPLTDEQVTHHIETVRTAHDRIKENTQAAQTADARGQGLSEIYKAFEDIKTASRSALESLDALLAHEEYHRIEGDLEEEAA